MVSLVSYAEANLRHLLRPIEQILSDRNMTNLHINGPGEGMTFLERGRGWERITLPYTAGELEDIAINAAACNNLEISDEHPIAEGKFPGNYRVHIVRPPAVIESQYVFSIRQPKAQTWTPEELEQAGVFDGTTGLTRKPRDIENRLRQLYRERPGRLFLEAATAAELQIVYTGKPDAGKTHVMRSFTHCINPKRRIITMEDQHELLNLPCPNVVHLMYAKDAEQSASRVTALECFEASLRLGPHGIIHQELRDKSAYAYWSALKSGIWTTTTAHTDHPEEAYTRIAGLIREHPQGMLSSEPDVIASLYGLIDVVVHCVKDGERRVVEQIIYDPDRKARYANKTNSLAA